jgi:hypothetical protein
VSCRVMWGCARHTSPACVAPLYWFMLGRFLICPRPLPWVVAVQDIRAPLSGLLSQGIGPVMYMCQGVASPRGCPHTCGACRCVCYMQAQGTVCALHSCQGGGPVHTTEIGLVPTWRNCRLPAPACCVGAQVSGFTCDLLLSSCSVIDIWPPTHHATHVCSRAEISTTL